MELITFFIFGFMFLTVCSFVVKTHLLLLAMERVSKVEPMNNMQLEERVNSRSTLEKVALRRFVVEAQEELVEKSLQIRKLDQKVLEEGYRVYKEIYGDQRIESNCYAIHTNSNASKTFAPK